MGLPLLRAGGILILYLGRLSEPDQGQREFASLLGAEIVKATPVDVPYLEGARHAWWFRKIAETPAEYPRRAAGPAKKPSG